MLTLIKKAVLLFFLMTVPLMLSFSEYTVLVYMAADNNLEEYANQVFYDIADVDTSARQVKIFTLYDRYDGEDSAGTWSETRRGTIDWNDVPDDNWGNSMGELNMGHPGTLIDFVNWGITNNPNDKYVVIFFDHGSGWQKSVCEDDHNGTMSFSADGGSSWTQFAAYDGLTGSKVNCVFAQGSTYYAGTDAGISVSADSGGTWTTYTTINGLGSDYVNAVMAVGNTIFAGTSNGLAVSTDNGSSWGNYTTGDGLLANGINDLFVDGSTVCVATDNGISYSLDNCATWSSNIFGSGNSVHVAGSSIYAGTNSGLKISANNGASWTDSLTGIPVHSVYVTGNSVYAGTDTGLHVSPDNGQNWTTYTQVDGLPFYKVESVYAVGSTIYAACQGRGLSISADSGLTWKTVTNTDGIGGDIITDIYADGTNVFTASVGRDYLSLKELSYAFNEITSNNNVTIDLLGFNACLMGMTEVMYEIGDYCDFIVASEEIEGALAWDYTSVFNEVVNNPNMTADAFGELFVSTYLAKGKYNGDIALIDCSQLASLAGEIDYLATTLQTCWNSNVGACQSAAQDVMVAVDTAVLANAKCGKWYGSHGLSIFFPSQTQSFMPSYNANVLSLAEDTHWDEFLVYYKNNLGGTWVDSARNQSQTYALLGGGTLCNENTDLFDFCWNLVFNLPDDLEVSSVDDYYTYKKIFAYNNNPGTTYTLTNNGATPISFLAAEQASWVELSQTSGTIPPSGSVDIDVSFTNLSNAFDYGVNVCPVYFTNLDSGKIKSRDIVLDVPYIDSFFEEVSSNRPFDLENTMLTFIPDEERNYKVWQAEADSLPVSTGNATPLDFSSVFSIDQQLTNNQSFLFFGEPYTTLNISKKGCVNFDESELEELMWPSDLNFYASRIRIAGLGANLTPDTGGTVYWEQLPDRAVVTFDAVESGGNSGLLNTFQMELFFSGKIRITYLTIDDTNVILGINNVRTITDIIINGESDFSAYYQIGDVNADRVVNMTDTLLTAAYVQNMNPPSFYAHVADVDGDGDVDTVDVNLINEYAAKLIDEFPCQN